MKSFTLDGKRHRLHERVPAGEIRWLVGHMHVGTTDLEVEGAISKRMNGPQWTKAIRRSAVAFALHCHRNNQGLVRRFRL